MPVISIAVTSYIKHFFQSPVAVVVSFGHVHTRNRHEIEQATDRRQNGTRKIWYQIGMTHSPEVVADFRRQLSVLKSGLCVISLA